LDAPDVAEFEAAWVAVPNGAVSAFVASCLALAADSADWSVEAHWPRACACPEPPQPAPQLSLLDWDWSAPWVVSASLYAFESAEFETAWVAEPNGPAFELVAFWSAFANEPADWSVSAD